MTQIPSQNIVKLKLLGNSHAKTFFNDISLYLFECLPFYSSIFLHLSILSFSLPVCVAISSYLTIYLSYSTTRTYVRTFMHTHTRTNIHPHSRTRTNTHPHTCTCEHTCTQSEMQTLAPILRAKAVPVPTHPHPLFLFERYRSY